MPDTRPDMRQRALLVTSNAACRWNKMLLEGLKVDIPRAALLLPLSTEHDERPDAIHQVWRSGRVTVVRFFQLRGPLLHTLKLFQQQAAFEMFNVVCTASLAERMTNSNLYSV